MQFTIDCDADLRNGPSLRLTKDGAWRQIAWPEPIRHDKDLVIDDSEQAAEKAGTFDVVEFEGLTYDAKHEMGMSFGLGPTGLMASELYASVFPRVHRDVKPRQFTLEEVRQAIASGDDTQDNCLIVDLDGHVQMCEANGDHPKDDPRTAVSLRMFLAGNEYAGKDASQDSNHVELSFNQLLHLWKRHRVTGEIGIIDDTFPYIASTDLLHEIEQLPLV